MFSCEFKEIFKNTSFYRTSLVAASVNWLSKIGEMKEVEEKEAKKAWQTKNINTLDSFLNSFYFIWSK